MGAHPWFYIVDYDANIERALRNLRQREFEAGRYYPAMRFPTFPVDESSPAPGAKHSSIQEAMEAAGESGTRSILDIVSISDTPNHCTVSPLAAEALARLYDTTKPNRQLVESNLDFFDGIERGQAISLVLYERDEPVELLFAGYSFD